MDFITLDYQYEPENIIEGYQSMIWTERYRDHGDFQLVAPLSNRRIRDIPTDKYMARTDSRYFMYIESVVEDEEKGTVTVKGRSVESVLKYRPTIGSQYSAGGDDVFTWDITGTPTAIGVVLARYALSEGYAPFQVDVPGLTVLNNAGAVGTSRTLGVRIGSSTYDVLKGQLDEVNVGFRIWRNYTTFDVCTFELYLGTNRSSTLVFSPDIDNLANTLRVRSNENFAELAAIYQDSPKGTQAYYYNLWYVQSSTDITPTGGLGVKAVPISLANVRSAQYFPFVEGQVRQNNKFLNYVDGSIPANAAGAVYGTDYFLGDTVGLRYNGVSSNARVIEHTTSVDSEGVRNYPTLEPV